jgi:hypothetical protein
MRHLLIALPLILCACGHNLTVVGRDGSHSEGSTSSGVGSGTAEVVMAGQTYRGRWTAMAGLPLG